MPLDRIKREFFEARLRFEPVMATFLGHPGYDDKLAMEDGSEREQVRAFFTRLLADLEGPVCDTLPPSDRIDVRIMRAAALWKLLSIEQPFPLGWRSETDISGLVDAVYYNVTRQRGRNEEWEAILARMERIPDFLAARRENLERGLAEKAPFYRREVVRDGIELQEEVLNYFRKDLPAAARASLPPERVSGIEKRLDESGRRIARALEEYARFLKASVLGAASDGAFAIGEEEYGRRLKHLLFSSDSPETLLAYGKRQVERTEREMQKAADRLARRRKEKPGRYAERVALLQKDAPGSDAEMLEMYRRLVERCVAFLRKRKMFALPPGYSIDILETPAAFVNVLSVAAMNSVPPFADGVPAQFWVTPTRSPDRPGGTSELLKLNHCRAAAPNLVVHEAVPGHDLQLGASARAFIAGGRRDLSYLVRIFAPDVMRSLGVEGWAHYTEELMAEEGFYGPEERLFQLKDAQWRNVRIVVDVGLHTGRMTYGEAVAYFEEKTRSGRLTAEREIYRYSKWPLQALTYHLGKRDLLELRRRAAKLAGPKFDLTRFHSRVLEYGGIPVPLYLEELLRRFKADKLRGRKK